MLNRSSDAELDFDFTKVKEKSKYQFNKDNQRDLLIKTIPLKMKKLIFLKIVSIS